MNVEEMTRWDQKARPQKNKTRVYALENLCLKKRSLWLPAAQCLCVAKARELGVLSDNSRLILVEKNRQVAEAMRITAGQWPWVHQPVVFVDELSNLKLGSPLDFAYLDFLGTLPFRTAEWMATELASHLAVNADIVVTLLYGWRNNELMYHLASEIKLQWSDCYEKLKKQVAIHSDQVVIPLAILKCIFHEFDFKVRWPLKYRDSQNSMLLYRLERFNRLAKGNGWPPFAELIEGLRKRGVTMATATKKRKAKPTGNKIEAHDVIVALKEDKPGAQKLFDRYVAQRVADGYSEGQVRAAIKAHVTRR
jgi:hypothetical protein